MKHRKLQECCRDLVLHSFEPEQEDVNICVICGYGGAHNIHARNYELDILREIKLKALQNIGQYLHP